MWCLATRNRRTVSFLRRILKTSAHAIFAIYSHYIEPASQNVRLFRQPVDGIHASLERSVLLQDDRVRLFELVPVPDRNSEESASSSIVYTKITAEDFRKLVATPDKISHELLP